MPSDGKPHGRAFARSKRSVAQPHSRRSGVYKLPIGDFASHGSAGCQRPSCRGAIYVRARPRRACEAPRDGGMFLFVAPQAGAARRRAHGLPAYHEIHVHMEEGGPAFDLRNLIYKAATGAAQSAVAERARSGQRGGGRVVGARGAS